MAFKHVYWANGCFESQRLSGKPMNVPLARTLDISNLNIEGAEIEGRNSVKCYIEDNQGPLEEGVSGVSWWLQSASRINRCVRLIYYLRLLCELCVE